MGASYGGLRFWPRRIKHGDDAEHAEALLGLRPGRRRRRPGRKLAPGDRQQTEATSAIAGDDLGELIPVGWSDRPTVAVSCGDVRGTREDGLGCALAVDPESTIDEVDRGHQPKAWVEPEQCLSI